MIWQRRRRLARMKVQGYSARCAVAGAALRERPCCSAPAARSARVFGIYGQLLISHALASVTGFPVVFSVGACSRSPASCWSPSSRSRSSRCRAIARPACARTCRPAQDCARLRAAPIHRSSRLGKYPSLTKDRSGAALVPGKPGRCWRRPPASCCGDCRRSPARSMPGEPGRRRSPIGRCAKTRCDSLTQQARSRRGRRAVLGVAADAAIDACCACSSPTRRSGTSSTTSASATRARQTLVSCTSRSARRSTPARRSPTTTAIIRGRTTAAIYARSWSAAARAARALPSYARVRPHVLAGVRRCAPSRAPITSPIRTPRRGAGSLGPAGLARASGR